MHEIVRRKTASSGPDEARFQAAVLETTEGLDGHRIGSCRMSRRLKLFLDLLFVGVYHKTS